MKNLRRENGGDFLIVRKAHRRAYQAPCFLICQKDSLMRFRLHRDEAGTVHEGMLQADGTFPRANHDTGTAVIALTGIHDDGVLPFHR